jgi:quercetin dioxygenase-like cupin family protein
MSLVSGRALQPIQHEPGLFAIKLIDGSRGARNVALLRGWLEPGASHSPHTHDAEEAVTFLAGRGVVTIGQQSFQVTEGDALLIPPHVIHSTTNDDESLTLHFVAAFSDAAIRSYPAGTSSIRRDPTAGLFRNRIRWYARQIWHRISRA